LSRLIGVLPAAGTAERLQPITGSKEVLALGGRPVLDYAVERLRAARPDTIRVVVRPEKADLTERARVLGLDVVEARPSSLAESIVAGIAPLADEDAVIVDLPDSIWEPVDGFKVLLQHLTAETDVVLAIFRSAEPERGDVVDVADEDRVVAVHAKSPDSPGDSVWGAFTARAGVLRGLDRYRDPGDCFDDLARRGRVRAVRFPGEFIDIGTKEALARARELLGT
jgi:NDP-sugar pyrophosphorylase family protein